MSQALLVPSGIIHLLKDMPLDNTYEHTIYFDNPDEQKEYFVTRPKITISATSYQRTTKGYIKVQKPIDELLNCTYMLFQGQEVSTKWYYAFITNVEYVNNITTAVYYQIDVIQTWMFDYVVAPCMIERQHTETDNIGDNIVNESININEYKTRKSIYLNAYESMSIVIMYDDSFVIPDGYEGMFTPGYYGGIYNGANFFRIPVTPENIEATQGVLDAFRSGGGIIAVFMMPSYFIPDNNSYSEDTKTYTVNADPPGSSNFTDIDGYIPRNNKLFTFPYVCVNVSGGGDAGINYAFENFNGVDNAVSFEYTCNFGPNATGAVVPLNYLGETKSYSNSVKFGPFPMCTWANSELSNWLNLGLISNLTGLGSKVALANNNINNAVPVYSYDPSNITPNTIFDIAEQNQRYNNVVNTNRLNVALNLAKAGVDFITTTTTSNLRPTPDSMYGFKHQRFPLVYTKTIKAFQAEIIDDYFTRYGYAINKIEIPNRHARKRWTYIKTNGFSKMSDLIPGVSYPETHKYFGVPASAWLEIVKIHDNGITYWDKGAKICDYRQLNEILEQEEV